MMILAEAAADVPVAPKVSAVTIKVSVTMVSSKVGAGKVCL